MVEKNLVSSLWPQLYQPLRQMGTRLADWIAPAADASSAEDAYRITLELPGVAEDDIHLTVDGGVVTVTGEKKTQREEKGETWYFSEREFGSFSRSFRVPPDADDAAVAADLKDGVLTITLPRRAPHKPEARRVPIARG